MNELLHLLNVNTTFITILGYPMSYVEFFGTIFNAACVWLVARKNILNWPIGILGVLLFGALFYQLRLYADLSEQIYYFITGFIGWYAWAKAKKPKDGNKEIVVKRNSQNGNIITAIVVLIGTLIGTYLMTHLNIWLPKLFPEQASLPLLDVFTTVMSFAATVLMIQKKLENWVLWIAVDIIGIWLYWHKGVPFVALLYVAFLIMATSGLVTWYRTFRRENNEDRLGNREILPAA
jgi:nicotinamide mononucleotide transporter